MTDGDATHNPLLGLFKRILALEKARGQPPPESESWRNPPEEPPPTVYREIVTIQAPRLAKALARKDVETTRAEMAAKIAEYLALSEPEQMLLIRALPGVGKTTAAVLAAEQAAREGQRVIYYGPRHDFFADVQAIATEPAYWYEWLPRQAGDESKVETCGYAREIGSWLNRGYEAMQFCSAICGWDYVNKHCRYHEQKRRREPCIFAQHLHCVQGHPLEFDLAIGDEYVMPAFASAPWHIPARWIIPGEMDPKEPLSELLCAMRKLASDGATVEGESLLTLLGGPAAVLDACAQAYALSGRVLAPALRRAEDVEETPYNLLPSLVPLLGREALAFQQYGDGYPHRIKVTEKGLDLLLRKQASDKTPKRLIWLDGTGDPRLYREAFGRPVDVYEANPALKARIYQMYERANGKTALLGRDGRPTSKAAQAQSLAQQIIEKGGYERPAVISFKGLVEESGFGEAVSQGHFYAARGTNVFEDADCLIVVGAPQPAVDKVVEQAKMLFFDRDAPFLSDWVEKLVPYSFVDSEGLGRAYPCSGFWNDPDLQAILNSVRESEVIQAAHRCRPVSREVDIWLLTNLPLDQLPPDELLSIRDVMGAPEGVHVFTWKDALDGIDAYLREAEESGRAITAQEFARQAKVSRPTAEKYMQLLVDTGDWVWERAIRAAKRGPIPRAIRWGRGRAQLDRL